MNRSTGLFVLLIAFATALGAGGASGDGLARSFRGTWVTTHPDCSKELSKLSLDEIKAYWLSMLDAAERINANAVIFQIRPSADAFYCGSLEPWSLYLRGEQGKAPEGGFDPLRFMIDECHARGMQLHAWFNPFRVTLHDGDEKRLSPDHNYFKHPEWFVKYGKSVYYDPGVPACREWTVRVVMDVVSRYDVDGVHIDDYFYPYSIVEDGKDLPFPDAASFAKYGVAFKDVNAWRDHNSDRLVDEVNRRLRALKSDVVFGVAPFYSNDYNLKVLHCDTVRWARNGWLDYIMPQLYYGEETRPATFWWDAHGEGRPVIAGQNLKILHRTVKAGPCRGLSEIDNMLQMHAHVTNFAGVCWWSSDRLMQNVSNVTDRLAPHYAKKTLVPLYPGRPRTPPESVADARADRQDGRVTLSWRHPTPAVGRPKAVFTAVFRGDATHPEVVTDKTSVTLDDGTNASFRLVALDRLQNAARPVVVSAGGTHSSSASTSQTPFAFVRRGEEPVTVVIPAEASTSVVYAAEELVSHVEKMTGVAMPVVRDGQPVSGRAVLLGLESPSATLGDDGWRLVVKGDRLSVIGSAERGVLYGVYELLERFGGCGWYSVWHTVVPRRDALTVPADLDLSETPAIAMRDENWYGPLTDPAFAARLRLNSRTYAKEPAAAKYGGAPHRFGAGLKSAHTHQTLLPAHVYFKTHPEYFAEVKGRRTDTFGQLCLTNPEVLAIVTSNVLAAIRRDPTARYFGVSQNDFEGYCTCARCTAVNDEEGSTAGTNIRFVNAVAEAIERDHPDKIIETLAYLYTRKPPKTRARKNVMICLCSIACDFAMPLVAPNDYVHNARFVADMCAWQEKCDRIYVWDYVTSFENFLAVFANENVLQPNVRFFRDHGAVGVFEQGAGATTALADLADLKCWLLAKLMWNPDASYDELVRRFTDGHYGKAAPLMREYLERRKALADYGTWRPWEDVETARVGTAFLEEASDLFGRAKELVKDDPACLRAVREAELSVDYMRLLRAGLHDRATPENRARAVRFLEDVGKYGPVRYSERSGHETRLMVLRRLADGLGMP